MSQVLLGENNQSQRPSRMHEPRKFMAYLAYCSVSIQSAKQDVAHILKFSLKQKNGNLTKYSHTDL